MADGGNGTKRDRWISMARDLVGRRYVVQRMLAQNGSNTPALAHNQRGYHVLKLILMEGEQRKFVFELLAKNNFSAFSSLLSLDSGPDKLEIRVALSAPGRVRLSAWVNENGCVDIP